MQGIILKVLQDPRLNLSAAIPREVIASQLQLYLELLIKWNRKINLTAEKDIEEILVRHVFDSLQFSRAVTAGDRIMDIGSGAGFPGIPLKILFPDSELTLVESQRKRCSFLEAVARDLKLDSVKVINSRAEDVDLKEIGKFNIVVFRAVSSADECLRLSGRFVCPGGKVILKKSPNEDLEFLKSTSTFQLINEFPIVNYYGLTSNLLVFENCST